MPPEPTPKAEAKVSAPAPLIESAAGVLVPYASVEVPMYRLPPMEETSQCLRLAEAEVSESAREGRVPATCRFQLGVVVPTPTLPPEVAKYAEPLDESAVVEAYGKVLAAVAVEVMAPVRASVEVAVPAPPKKAAPLVY